MTAKSMHAYLLCSAACITILFGYVPTANADSASQSANGVETVVVTGSRAEANEARKDAPIVLDIASLQQIRSLPDANAAEVLQRLPGISMESDSGEGRFINIRGMDADLNGTSYDGVRLMANNPASPQGGARAVAFDAFPAGILGGVEVAKSLTPDMDAEGLGGAVNILPRTIPMGQDHILDASAGTGIETLRNKPVYKADITAGERFDDGKVSIIFSYGYEQDHRGIDDIEADYINDPTAVPAGTSAFLAQKAFDDVQYRWYEYHRTRQGFGGGITFSPDDDTNLYLRGFHAGYVEIGNKHEFVLNGLADDITSVNNASGDFSSSGVESYYSDINTKEILGNDLIELGGNTLIADTVKMDARVSWTEGHDRFPYSINARFKDPNAFDVVYNNLDANRPVYQTATDVTDPSLYTTLANGNGPSKNTDTEYAGVMNFLLPIDVAGDGGMFKFGGSVRERTRKADAFNAGFVPDTLSLSDYVSGPDVIYYKGEYDIGPQPIYSKLLTIPETPLVEDPTTFEDDNENVFAGYAQYSTSFGQLDVVGGVRVEGTDGTYRANDVDGDGNLIGLHTTTHSYTNVFPDLSLKYQASDDLQLRAVYSTAIARPGFNQITAARSIDLSNANPIITQGNPDLKPTTGQNLDLMASYFLPHSEIASVGLFYKAFSNYIIPTEQVNDTNVPGFVGQNVDLISYSNIGSAHAEGIELEYNQQFDFLPVPLDGFGFDGNLTYVQSRGEIRPGEQHALPQTSPFNYNAGIYYQQGPLYLKLAASYVSINLWAVGGDDSTDLYSQARFRLDFGGTYDITDQIELYADIKNITNTHLEFTQTKSKNFPVQNEFYDADYLGGIRVKI
ncbi:MAG TPA: TonB-dependent receptor [Rhizomicrobium sp.]|nr:TonB-dependent receptor [Rhizomicrobium sp.]